MNRRFARYLLVSTMISSASAVTAQTGNPATAVDEAPASEIVVTGSRIGRADLDQASPVSVIGAEEFALSGQVNVENVLKDLPQLVPSLSGASNNPGGGVATADLRGLGATRTLVLVNNRRYLSYDSSQIVDLNTIPAGLIERVDIVSGGRSARASQASCTSSVSSWIVSSPSRLARTSTEGCPSKCGVVKNGVAWSWTRACLSSSEPTQKTITSGNRSPVASSTASGRGVRKKTKDFPPTW